MAQRVFADLAVQRGSADPEPLGGLDQVIVCFRKDTDDCGPFDVRQVIRGEDRSSGRPGNGFGQVAEIDGLEFGKHDRAFDHMF